MREGVRSVVMERERHRLIRSRVEERSVVTIGELVDLLGASEATVRRDIVTLAEAGEIQRVRGGAEALNPRHHAHLAGAPLALSMGICTAEKRAIARTACALIADGDSIVIGGGSTTYRMIEFLGLRDLDILTNSFPVAARLAQAPRIRLTLPGGTLFREHSIVLSPFEDDSIGHFWGSRLFIGCHGLNRFGMMETDPLIVQAARKLLARVDEVVVLADSRKLRQRSSMVVAGLDRIGTLITDVHAQDSELDVFRKAGVTVLVAPVAEDDAEIEAAA